MLSAAKPLTYIILVLLPAVQLFRDWKYKDARTLRHHQITRWMLLVWLACAVISAGFYWSESLESAALQRKVDELLAGNKRLLLQNERLASSVEAYQADLKSKEQRIRELDLQAKMAARGVTKTYDFNGARRQTTAGSSQVVVGSEVEVFEQMAKLDQAKDFTHLLEVCEQQKLKTPEWLTPFLFCGAAYANIGARDKAIENLTHVTDNAPGDPNYQLAGELLARLGAAR